MDALDLLLNRASVARLHDPAPTTEQRDLLFRAALRAPDHGQLRPFRFICVEGEGRVRLGELFAEAVAAGKPEVAPEALSKALAMPLRAPLLVVVVACLREHPKVPQEEQVITAGCAAHGVLLAAQAIGLGGIWRTGELASNAVVDSGLGLAANERIVGFLYLGNLDGERRTPQSPAPAEYVSGWPA
ncbi:nitroreductase family protein [Pseudomonas sp. LRF_L74]|uniref:nitroreductase family protein n=1 Tax=Pseudomonas sp. LRF_L74 TaxID=3369422 RepID=UPI003F5F5372